MRNIWGVGFGVEGRGAGLGLCWEYVTLLEQRYSVLGWIVARMSVVHENSWDQAECVGMIKMYENSIFVRALRVVHIL